MRAWRRGQGREAKGGRGQGRSDRLASGFLVPEPRNSKPSSGPGSPAGAQEGEGRKRAPREQLWFLS